MKVLAFYLPQFHKTKENNEWWGEGFTEWTNVTKARPLYSGHYQPQLPRDMGFYDLRVIETQKEQVKMAKDYGIDGFCYYHYWFNEKMLLERPFNDLLSNKDIDTSFCLCWANENWTRRWDGKDQEILIEQDYEKYDPIKHIKWLINAFKDQRYVKIDGNPLFLIYRINLIPNLKEVISIWREVVKKEGFKDIHICAADYYDTVDFYNNAKENGVDSIYEFNPNFGKKYMKSLNLSNIDTLDIYDYKYIVEKEKEKVPYGILPQFPCVFPSWDNTPRKNKLGSIIQNTDERLYADWLKHSIKRSKNYNNVNEQIVFINAWNEWAEGCHLEPDMKNGKKFLEATKLAIQNEEIDNTKKDKEARTFLENSNYEENSESKIVIDDNIPIYIWGTGAAAKKTYELLSNETIELSGFIDNNESKWNTEFLGKSIYSIHDLLNKVYNEKIFIIIASMYYEDIAKQLNAMGLYNNKHYIKALSQKEVKREYDKIIINSSRCCCNVCGSRISLHINNCEMCNSSMEYRSLIDCILKNSVGNKLPLLLIEKFENINILDLNNQLCDNMSLKFNIDKQLENNKCYDIILIKTSLNQFRKDINQYYYLKKYLKYEGKIIVHLEKFRDEDKKYIQSILNEDMGISYSVNKVFNTGKQMYLYI